MTRDRSFAAAVNEALREEMNRDPETILFGQDVRYGYLSTATRGLVDEFGESRVINSPIAENSMVGTGVGAAMGGCPTIVEAQFCDALLLAFDQLMNQAPKPASIFDGQLSVPLVIRTLAGHFPGAFGPHHSKNLTALFTHIPGLKVVAPSTPYEAKGLLKTAIRDQHPVLVAEHVRLVNSSVTGTVPAEEYTIPFDDGVETLRDGTDAVVFASSWLTTEAMEAASTLEADGLDVKVVNIRVLDPLDRTAILEAVRGIGSVVIADEGYPRCGLSADIAAGITDEDPSLLDTPIERVNTLNTPIPANMEHQNHIIPDKSDIVAAVQRVVQP